MRRTCLAVVDNMAEPAPPGAVLGRTSVADQPRPGWGFLLTSEASGKLRCSTSLGLRCLTPIVLPFANSLSWCRSAVAVALHPSFSMTAPSFFRQVLIESGRPSLDDAKRATAVVFQTLRDRLTPDEADQAAAQLPRPLKLLWWRGDVDGRRPLKMHRKEFYAGVQRDAGLASEREARQVTNAVFAALKEQLSPGEADDILGQLPKDLKTVWEDS